MLANNNFLDRDLLCEILRDEPEATTKLICNIDAYINKAASSPLYDSNGNYVGTFISEDLKQDIIFQVIRCIPNLKRNIISQFF